MQELVNQGDADAYGVYLPGRSEGKYAIDPDWATKEQKVGLPFSGSPEGAALDVLRSEGWRGEHTEGSLIRGVFRALLLPYLIEHNPYKSVDLLTPMRHAIHYLIPMTAQGIDDLLIGGRNVRRDSIIAMHKAIDERLHHPKEVQIDFERICEVYGQVWPKAPSGRAVVADFIRAIPIGFWHNLLEIYSRYDGLLAHGWPDLELTNGQEVLVAEVKVKDRLTASQKETIPILISMGLQFRLIRILRTN